MQLSSASKHLPAVGRGSGRRSIDGRNAACGSGILYQTRDSKTHDRESYGISTERPMPMDEDGLQRQGYAYNGEEPWSAPPAKDSNPTVSYATPSNNAAPQIRQFSGTLKLGFSIGEDKRSEINVPRLLKRVMAFPAQTDGAFRIDPLNGSAQSITNPNTIPTTK
jgi:hypothetical protein